MCFSWIALPYPMMFSVGPGSFSLKAVILCERLQCLTKQWHHSMDSNHCHNLIIDKPHVVYLNLIWITVYLLNLTPGHGEWMRCIEGPQGAFHNSVTSNCGIFSCTSRASLFFLEVASTRVQWPEVIVTSRSSYLKWYQFYLSPDDCWTIVPIFFFVVKNNWHCRLKDWYILHFSTHKSTWMYKVSPGMHTIYRVQL